MLQRMRNQSGNAFMMVFIGIILFGALAYTFSRTSRQGISNISPKQAGILAGEVLSYAQTVEKGISRMRVKKVSESDIDFVGADPTYDNAGCAVDKCEVFNPAGGQQAWISAPTNANNGAPWAFTGAIRIAGIAQDAGDAASAELSMFLPNVTIDVCRQINNRLGVENPGDDPPAATAGVNYNTKFTGTYSNGGRLTGAQLDGKTAACYADGGSYHFYQVLVAR